MKFTTGQTYRHKQTGERLVFVGHHPDGRGLLFDNDRAGQTYYLAVYADEDLEGPGSARLTPVESNVEPNHNVRIGQVWEPDNGDTECALEVIGVCGDEVWFRHLVDMSTFVGDIYELMHYHRRPTVDAEFNLYYGGNGVITSDTKALGELACWVFTVQRLSDGQFRVKP